jgi:molecular chaperone DnaJ
MSKRDYYEVLGVDRDAHESDLKRAFRKKAMESHPDRHPGDTEAEHRFKEVNEAYEVLKDPQKRAAYDQFGHAAFEHGMGPGDGGFHGGFEFNFGGGFADIFEEMFGDFTGRGRSRRREQARGQDLRYNMEITLEDAFEGKQATIEVPTSVGCEACQGSGGEGGAQPVACPTCGGRGRVRASQGFFTVERTCAACQGTGETISDPCKACGGAGRVHSEKTLSVNIPAGVDDGTRIRLAGEGEAGVRGAPPGDLYIFISIAPHEIFMRDGPNIYCQVPIPMTTAALGGDVEVPCVDGSRAKVTVPNGTQNGEQFRLRGKGMSVLRSRNRGDMYIEMEVETPRNLTAEQKKILEQFREAGGDETSPKSERFFERVKTLWEAMKG